MSRLLYNNDGEVSSLTDANQNQTTFNYDQADRLNFRQDALGNQWTYGYDADGNLNSVQDPKGQTETYTYDPLERLQFAGYTPPHSSSYESTINYTYSTNGENRLVQALDSTGGTFNQTYDQFGELSQESGPNGTINYNYNPDGTRASATVSGQPQVSYGYNDDGLLTSASNGSQSASLSYDNTSRLQKVTLPDGISQNYTYDPASRPTDVVYDNSSGTQIGDLHYQLDPDGNRTAEWGSDARLTIPQATQTAIYNADNELSSIGATSYTYDANGNHTSDGSNNYTWNARNQLTAISGQSAASFTYDPFGRREQATIAGKSTSYLDDGQNVAQELASGTPSVNYLLGPGLDQRFARTDSNATQSYLTDLLGSTLALGNADQTLPTTYTYDPFGAVTAAGTSSTNPYQFAGQQNDGTGLNYDRARYYNPSQGTFTSPDPLGNTTSGPDLYQYAKQNPTTSTDPTGLDSSGPSGPGLCLAQVLSGAKNTAESLGCALGTLLLGTLPWEAAADDVALADTAATEDVGGTVGDIFDGATCGGQSFSANTKVKLADGRVVSISHVRVGEKVLATNPATGKVTAERVTRVWLNRDHDLLDLAVRTRAGETVIHTTQHHLFYDRTRHAWVQAEQLRLGDSLDTGAGTPATIAAVRTLRGGGEMWDLSVAHDHDFFVGVAASVVLVHNCPAGLPTPLTTTQAEELANYLGYTRTNFISAGQRVFTNGKLFITHDVTSHSGGIWKVASSVEGLASKQTRIGTADALLNIIGP